MQKRLIIPGIVFAALTFSPAMRSQSGRAVSPPSTDPPLDGWGRIVAPPAKDRPAAPAPRRDISGIWDPGTRGNQVLGAAAMPEDGKPEHRLPYTPAGLEKLKTTKPSNGVRSALPAETNDPIVFGDPQGMPREDLFILGTTQILQRPENVVMLCEFGRVWRIIWTDGREVPKDPEPRWFGYSVGKWVDDYTFVVETTGTDERTWLDRSGRPHSDELRIEERFHRPDRDHLELTVTIDDPKMYTKPWVALNKLVFDLAPPSYDVREMIWSPTEFQEYNKLVGAPASER